MAPNYYIQYNVGRCKYCLNFHDGQKTHNDGSPFYDLRIFSNKKHLQAAVNDLHRQGYKYRELQF